MGDPTKDTVSPWHPMTNPVDIKCLGKLIEELGELQAACARCLIQGIDESEPTTGKVNRAWLEDGIADVLAGFEMMKLQFEVYPSKARILRKIENLKQWHKGA